MFKTPHNYKTVSMKLTRIELCDLMLACTIIKQNSGATKWATQHDKLEAILQQFDETHPIDE